MLRSVGGCVKKAGDGIHDRVDTVCTRGEKRSGKRHIDTEEKNLLGMRGDPGVGAAFDDGGYHG
jgi:hypothetical protein